MSVLARDPLLVAVRLILTLLMIATLAATAAFVGASGALAIAPASMLDWLGDATGSVIPTSAAGPLTGVFALLAGMSLLAFVAQRLLRRLIDSVSHGDPFVPENARRLGAMAWLTLAVQVLSIGVASMIGWSEYAKGPLNGQFGFSLGGILLALVLFVLARVFRKGAAMREELEGTV